MKLVDILAYKLIDWPRSVVAFVQGHNGCIYPAGGGMEVYFMKSELAEDWELTEVTHKEWLAAVEAKNGAPQNDESQNVALIDWSKAPDGWRLVPIRPTKEMRAAAGREESKYNESRHTFFAGDAWAPMVANAPEYAADQWRGEGHPPAGAVCEMTTNDGHNWRPVKIIFFDDYVTMIGQVDGQVNRELFKRCDADVAFRPIRTPEQIAADERKSAIKEMIAIVGGSEQRACVELYDAGYRKP